MLKQAFSCLVTGIASFLVDAITGGVTSIIGFIRTMVFKQKGKFNKQMYIAILIIFEVIAVITAAITYQSLWSILPAFNTLLRTYCIWNNDLKAIRWSAVEMGIVLGIYYLVYGACVMAVGYFVVCLVSILAIIKSFRAYSLQESK